MVGGSIPSGGHAFSVAGRVGWWIWRGLPSSRTCRCFPGLQVAPFPGTALSSVPGDGASPIGQEASSASKERLLYQGAFYGLQDPGGSDNQEQKAKNYSTSDADPGLYVSATQGGKTFALVYVDDILIAALTTRSRTLEVSGSVPGCQWRSFRCIVVPYDSPSPSHMLSVVD